MIDFRVIFGLGLLATVSGTVAGQPIFGSGSEHLHIPVVIDLPKVVNINAERLYLADVTNCWGYEVYCEEAYSVDLGKAPAPGSRTTITRKQVKEILEKEWPLAIIDYTGAARTTVSVESATISRDEIEGEFLSILTPLFAAESGVRFRIERIRVPYSVKVLPGEYELKANDLKTFAGKSLEWITNRVAGSKQYRFTHRPLLGVKTTEFKVRARIVVERLVPVAARRLPKGTKVQKDDVTSTWTNIAKIRPQALLDHKSIVGRTTRQTHGVGKIFGRNSVEYPDMVRRGQELTVIVKRGGLVLTRQGKALRAGKRGEVIPLEMSGRQKGKGKIIAPDRAEFLF